VHTDIFDDVTKSVQALEVLDIGFGDAEIKDVKFVDDVSLMILLKIKGATNDSNA
jgi:hypothetical protein